MTINPIAEIHFYSFTVLTYMLFFRLRVCCPVWFARKLMNQTKGKKQKNRTVYGIVLSFMILQLRFVMHLLHLIRKWTKVLIIRKLNSFGILLKRFGSKKRVNSLFFRQGHSRQYYLFLYVSIKVHGMLFF